MNNISTSKSRVSFHLRSIALTLCVCLLVTDVAQAAPMERRSSPAARDSKTKPNTTVLDNNDLVRIPPRLGTVEEAYASPRAASGGRPATVYYIQDAHDSLEAQENIAKIIHYLVKHSGVKTVFEEGYEGVVPTDKYFSGIKDPALKQKVAHALMSKLLIGGAEYAHITRIDPAVSRQSSVGSEKKNSRLVTEDRRQDFQLIGADNVQLHLENIEWYRQAAQTRKTTDADLRDLAVRLQLLAERELPKEVKEWMKLRKRFDIGELDLLEYLKRLVAIRSLGAIHEFPLPDNILTVLQATRLRTPESLEAVQNISHRKLFSEIDQLEYEFANKKLQDLKQQTIFRYGKILNQLLRLNALEISFEEYEAIQGVLKTFKTEELLSFITHETRQSLALSKQWETNIRRAMRFYKLAEERDKAVEQTLKKYELEVRRRQVEGKTNETLSKVTGLTSDERRAAGDLSAILVFGGFHKENIKEILRRNGFSYVVIAPKISAIHEKDRALYRKLMSRGVPGFSLPPIAHLATRYAPIFEIGEFLNQSARMSGIINAEVKKIEGWQSQFPDERGPALVPAYGARTGRAEAPLKQSLTVLESSRRNARSEMRVFIEDLVRQQFVIAGVPFRDEHLRTGVGIFRPTLSGLVEPLTYYAQSIKPIRIIDLGSGQGAMVFAFARANEQAEVLGIEYDEMLYKESTQVRESFFEPIKKRIRLERGDFNAPQFAQDIQKADLINYWETGSAAEGTLLNTLAQHMQPGAKFLTMKNSGRFIREISASGYFDLTEEKKDLGISIFKRNEATYQAGILEQKRSEVRMSGEEKERYRVPETWYSRIRAFEVKLYETLGVRLFRAMPMVLRLKEMSLGEQKEDSLRAIIESSFAQERAYLSSFALLLLLGNVMAALMHFVFMGKITAFFLVVANTIAFGFGYTSMMHRYDRAKAEHLLNRIQERKDRIAAEKEAASPEGQKYRAFMDTMDEIKNMRSLFEQSFDKGSFHTAEGGAVDLRVLPEGALLRFAFEATARVYDYYMRKEPGGQWSLWMDQYAYKKMIAAEDVATVRTLAQARLDFPGVLPEDNADLTEEKLQALEEKAILRPGKSFQIPYFDSDPEASPSFGFWPINSVDLILPDQSAKRYLPASARSELREDKSLIRLEMLAKEVRSKDVPQVSNAVRRIAKNLLRGEALDLFLTETEPSVRVWAYKNSKQYLERTTSILRSSQALSDERLLTHLRQSAVATREQVLTLKLRRLVTSAVIQSLARGVLNKRMEVWRQRGQVYNVVDVEFYGSLVESSLTTRSDIDYQLVVWDRFDPDQHVSDFSEHFTLAFQDFLKEHQLSDDVLRVRPLHFGLRTIEEAGDFSYDRMTRSEVRAPTSAGGRGSPISHFLEMMGLENRIDSISTPWSNEPRLEAVLIANQPAMIRVLIYDKQDTTERAKRPRFTLRLKEGRSLEVFGENGWDRVDFLRKQQQAVQDKAREIALKANIELNLRLRSSAGAASRGFAQSDVKRFEGFINEHLRRLTNQSYFIQLMSTGVRPKSGFFVRAKTLPSKPKMLRYTFYDQPGETIPVRLFLLDLADQLRKLGVTVLESWVISAETAFRDEGADSDDTNGKTIPLKTQVDFFVDVGEGLELSPGVEEFLAKMPQHSFFPAPKEGGLDAWRAQAGERKKAYVVITNSDESLEHAPALKKAKELKIKYPGITVFHYDLGQKVLSFIESRLISENGVSRGYQARRLVYLSEIPMTLMQALRAMEGVFLQGQKPIYEKEAPRVYQPTSAEKNKSSVQKTLSFYKNYLQLLIQFEKDRLKEATGISFIEQPLTVATDDGIVYHIQVIPRQRKRFLSGERIEIDLGETEKSLQGKVLRDTGEDLYIKLFDVRNFPKLQVAGIVRKASADLTEQTQLALLKDLENGEPVSELIWEVLGVRALKTLERPETQRWVELTDERFAYFPEQLQVIRRSIAGKSIEVIWGPPGTGKTTTGAELARQLVKTQVYHTRLRRRESFVVMAHTHRAVDNMLLALKASGKKVLRLGSDPAEFDPLLREDWIFADAPTDRYSAEYSRWQGELLEKVRNGEIIVGGTITSVINSFFVQKLSKRGEEFLFDRGIIEEASVIAIPQALVALSKISKQAFLVGDPNQLGVQRPTKEQWRYFEEHGLPHQSENEAWLTRSILDYILPLRGVDPVMLRDNFRSPELLVELTNFFYKDQLRSVRKLSPEANRRSLIVIDTKNLIAGQRVEAGETSLFNEEEQRIITGLIEGIGSIDQTALGIVTPYRAQAQNLEDAMTQQLNLKGHENAVHPIFSRIGTAWPFQGREFPLMIISGVVSSVAGDFITWEMMNVLMSRAKNSQVIVFNSDAYLRSRNKLVPEFTRKLIELATQKGIYVELKPNTMEDQLTKVNQQLLQVVGDINAEVVGMGRSVLPLYSERRSEVRAEHPPEPRKLRMLTPERIEKINAWFEDRYELFKKVNDSGRGAGPYRAAVRIEKGADSLRRGQPRIEEESWVLPVLYDPKKEIPLSEALNFIESVMESLVNAEAQERAKIRWQQLRYQLQRPKSFRQIQKLERRFLQAPDKITWADLENYVRRALSVTHADSTSEPMQLPGFPGIDFFPQIYAVMGDQLSFQMITYDADTSHIHAVAIDAFDVYHSQRMGEGWRIEDSVEEMLRAQRLQNLLEKRARKEKGHWIMENTVRRTQVQDLPLAERQVVFGSIKAIHQNSGFDLQGLTADLEHELLRTYPGSHELFMVARSGVDVGYALVSRQKDPQSASIYTLYVRQDWAHKGIYELLLDQIFNYLQSRGIETVSSFIGLEEQELLSITDQRIETGQLSLTHAEIEVNTQDKYTRVVTRNTRTLHEFLEHVRKVHGDAASWDKDYKPSVDVYWNLLNLEAVNDTRSEVRVTDAEKARVETEVKHKAIRDLEIPTAVFLDAGELARLTPEEAEQRMKELLALLTQSKKTDFYLDGTDRYPVQSIQIPKFQQLLEEYSERIHVGARDRARLAQKKIVIHASLFEKEESAEVTAEKMKRLKRNYKITADILPLEYIKPGALKAFLGLAELGNAAELVKKISDFYAVRGANGRWQIGEAYLASVWQDFAAHTAVAWAA